MTKNKIGIIGSGQVAQVLGAGFLKHGFDVKMGSRDRSKLDEWKSKANVNIQTGSMEDAATFGEIIVLAVKGNVAEDLVKKLSDKLSGKTIIDTTNPIADAAPENGVLKFFTDINSSLIEKLQKAVPAANFVKAFSCVGSALMVNPQLKGGKPSMFICGNNAASKNEVKTILEKFGWETEDVGAVEAGRGIEPLCILWCIPGFLSNDWMHAFKMLRS